MRRPAVFRATLFLCVVLPLLSGLLTACGPGDGTEELTVISFGGAYQAAQSKAYMKPFEAAEGVEVLEGDYNGEYALLAQRATAPQGSWDVVSVESAPCARGALEKIFAPIPDSVTEGLDLVAGAKREFAVGHLVFSTVLAYDTRAFPVGEGMAGAPRDWGDFWDVGKFPGKRGLRNNPRGTLEVALLADGVAPGALYPLDVERALTKLEGIRGELVFWESGAQPLQLLANGTVVMSSAYNGRVWNGKVKEGLSVDWTWNQGLAELEFWAVPVNAPHRETAFDFIRFSLGRDRQAAFANEIAYGPVNLDSISLVKPDIRQALPTQKSVLSLQVPVDADWWADNEKAVSARWERWMGKR